jgi:hypothetical protein
MSDQNKLTWRKKATGTVLSLLFLVAATSLWAADEPQFTNQSLQGKWAFSGSGTIVPPATPQPAPAVAVGIMTFDGNGGCSITDTINIGGASLSRSSLSCTYVVDADGQGSLTAQFPGDPGPTPLALVLISNNEFRFIRKDLGVASGVASRQKKG